MMEQFIIYQIELSLGLFLFYGIFLLFMRNDTFFKLNRYFLISSIVLSAIIPLFKVSFTAAQDTTYYFLLETIHIGAQQLETSLLSDLTLFQSIAILYLVGVSVFFIRFLIQLTRILFIISKYGIQHRQGLRFVYTRQNYMPFSFFNIIFLNNQITSNDDINRIIAHEKIHIEQRHSIDLVIIELMSIIQWFNPMVWMYKKEIKGLHEYLADEGILQKGFNKVHYQQLLMNQTLGIQVGSLTNNFSKSLIKRRFIMMSKSKTPRMAKLKFLMVLPASLVLAIAFVLSVNTQAIAQSDKVKSEKPLKVKEIDGKKVYKEVEEMPTFPGGDKAMYKYIGANLKYPEKARKEGIAGKVYVTYIVNKNGSISNVKVKKGIGYGCDEAAVDVVKNMPKWTPGKDAKGKTVNVAMVLPFSFNLDDGAKKKEMKISKEEWNKMSDDEKKAYKMKKMEYEKIMKKKKEEEMKKKQAMKEKQMKEEKK